MNFLEIVEKYKKTAIGLITALAALIGVLAEHYASIVSIFNGLGN